MRLGGAARVGMDDDVGAGELGEYSLFRRDNGGVRRFEGQRRVQIDVHLHMNIGSRRSRPELMNIRKEGVGGHQVNDPGAVIIWQFAIHQLVRGLAKNTNRSPEQKNRDDEGGDGV